MTENKNPLERESLALHASGRPGKIEIKATKPLAKRFVFGVFSRSGRAVSGNSKKSRRRFPLYGQRKSGRRYIERNGGSGTGEYWFFGFKTRYGR